MISHRYREAAEGFRKTLEIDPNYDFARGWLAQALTKKGLLLRHHLPNLDEKDEAFRLMETSHEQRDSGLRNLKAHPVFDPLRSDPTFQDLE